MAEKTEVLKVEHLTKIYDFEGDDVNVVLDDVNFSLYKGEVLGIIGESGSGKSILARCIGARGRVTSGKITLLGQNITYRKAKFLVKRTQRKIQTIFQIPSQSFPDIERSVGFGIEDALRQSGLSKAEAKAKAPEMMELVGLEAEYLDSHCDELSGGQCQRAAIAKALSMNPEVIICDEALSSLDNSSQNQILNLLLDEKKKRGFAMLFISHDIKILNAICDRIIVMKEGKIVEEGKPEKILFNADLPYTRELVENLLGEGIGI